METDQKESTYFLKVKKYWTTFKEAKEDIVFSKREIKSGPVP